MGKQRDKQDYIGRDMYKDDFSSQNNRQYNSNENQQDSHGNKQTEPDNTQQAKKQVTGSWLGGFAIEIIVVVIFFFIVISTALSYEKATPFLKLQTNLDNAILYILNPES